MADRIWRGAALELPAHATVPDLVFQQAARNPAAIALCDSASGDSTAYGALADSVKRIAAALEARGLGHGMCAAIYAPNSPEWMMGALGTMAAGGCVTGASPLMKAEELARQLTAAKARFLFTVPGLLAQAREAASRAGSPDIILIGGKGDDTTAFSELLVSASHPERPGPGQNGVALLPFSSGTTGLPKGVDLTHRALVASAYQMRAWIGLTAHDVVLAIAPFCHILGSAIVMCGGLAAGSRLVTVPRYDFEALLDIIEHQRISVAFVAPPVMKALAEHPAVDRHDLSRLRLIASGGAPMAAGIEEAVARRIPATIVQGYGMTETSGTISANPPAAPCRGTCGRLFALTQARIVDPDTGRDRPAGESGEVWVRGPQMMRGYFGDGEATRTTLTEGWLRTGDLGLFDSDDYLHIVGRLKELIKVHAHQVAPAELEALLVTHPAIADAAVVGRPNQQTGEAPVAYVVTRATLDPQELMSWVAARVAPYKKVRAVAFVQEIPRSPSGKILRHLLEAAQTHPLPRSRS